MATDKLIVIVGPTASGKTSLAIDLAARYGGEIICADSRTVYKGMDIGTAKPSLFEQHGVPHWGLDLVNPGESFNVAMFKEYADRKITDIRRRGKVPFIVGGTGLYIDAVLFNYQFGPSPDVVKRSTLGKLDLCELHQYCNNNNIKIPENSKNKRYVIREIERRGVSAERQNIPLQNSIIVGITTPRSILRSRVSCRAKSMVEAGVVDEAVAIIQKFGDNSEAATGSVYRIIKDFYMSETGCVDDLVEQFIKSDMGLIKRQMTWFRRNPFIVWGTASSAEHYLSQILEDQ